MDRHIEKVIGKTLGKLLLEEGIITNSQLKEALNLQKETGMILGECMEKLRFVTEPDILNCIMVQYGVPYLPLRKYMISRSVLRYVPEEIARKNKLIPVDKIGNILTLAMSNPLDVKLIQDLEEKTGHKIEVFISTSKEILDAISENYGSIEK